MINKTSHVRRLPAPGVLWLLPLLCAFAAGCGGSASISSWQRSVERYVQQNGNDANVLRDMTLADTRRGFGQIGGEDPRSSTDANGLLLAHREISTHPWFIYLVGIVSNQKVENIQLAAVSFAKNGKATWHVGKKNDKSLHAYQQYNAGLWRQEHGDPKAKPSSSYTTFPRDEDKFDVTVAGAHVQAVHATSGAKWDVDVAAKK